MSLTDADVRRFWEKVDRRGPDECWPWARARHSAGYGQFWLSSAGRSVGAHTVAALLGLGPGEGWVLHHCDNPPCVNPAHLYYGTPADNSRDCDTHGNRARGERQGLARLTESAVRAMREAYAAGAGTPELGRHFGVHTATAHRVVTRQTWRHVA